MKGNLIFISLISFLLATSLSCVNTIESDPVQPMIEGTTLYVGGDGPENYSTIQDAVDNATNYDDIFVYNGIYYENIVIDIEITGSGNWLVIEGENKDNTIIDGGENGNVIEMSARKVKIQNFTIKNSGQTHSGILIDNKDNQPSYANEIYDNKIIDNYYGIYFTGEGTYPSCSIYENNIKNNNYGIFLASEDCYIYDNNISGNSEYGIYLNSSSIENVIYRNIFTQNNVNAYDLTNWDDSDNNRWFQYPNIGNYWDDYNGTDSDDDGVGDVYYHIPGGDNHDFYPLGFFNEQPIADAGGPYQGDINQEISFDASSSYDPDGNIEGYRWDFDNDGTYDTNWLTISNATYSYSNYGTYNVKLQVKDNEGATNTSKASVDISEPTNLPPSANAGGPYEGLTNENITFNASESYDPEGNIEGYRWDFDNDESYDTNWLSQPTTHYTYEDAGIYIIRVQVKDDENLTDSDTAMVTISDSDNILPVADADGPYNGYVDENITFDGSNSNDSDGEIMYYRWDFENDGTYDTNWLTNPTINTSYSSAKTYSVKLQVKDDKGATDTDITSAKIKNRENNPPNKPKINGPITGDENKDYEFTMRSTDPDNDKIRYVFYWNDSSNKTYTEHLISGIEYSFMKNWSKQGIYRLTAYAEDIKNETSDNSEFQIFIDIDILFIKELDGYLLDYEKDDIYDKYYHNFSTPTNIELQEDGKYKIDEDGDNSWDYLYDPVSGGITNIDEDKETKEKEDDNLAIIIGVFILIIVIAVVLVFILFRKKIFGKDKKETSTPKKIKGKCPSCGKEFSSYLSEENGFEFAVCNNCGKKLKRKKK